MSQSGDEALTQDVVFDLLSSPRRRFVLYHLQRADGPVELGDLADEVAAWENETTVEDLTSQQRKRVYVSLYQTHVPKLQEVGVVEYDQDSGLVAFAEGADDIGQYLAREEDSLRWGWYYLALAIAGTLFFLGAVYDVAVLGAVSVVAAGLLVTFAFVLLATAQRIYVQRRESGELLALADRER